MVPRCSDTVFESLSRDLQHIFGPITVSRQAAHGFPKVVCVWWRRLPLRGARSGLHGT